MKKLFAAAALALAFASSAAAAPALGVEWRAPANPDIPGVKITSVDAGGNAEELGLEEGDLVLAINEKVVRTGKDATAAVQAAKGKLTLLVQDVRGGGLVEITAEIDEPTKGFAAGAGKAGYRNVTRKAKK